MDLFGKKHIEYLEQRIADLEINAYMTEMRSNDLKEEMERREKALQQKGLEQRQQLEHLQKRLHRIREAALMVRAGKSPVEKLMQEILHGKVR
jgi:6-phosphogluconate dehydrogenase